MSLMLQKWTNRGRTLVVLAGAVAFVTGGMKADTLTWVGTGGGNWSVAANWSSDGSHTVPQPGDTIKINTLKSGETYNNDIVGLSTRTSSSAANPMPPIPSSPATRSRSPAE